MGTNMNKVFLGLVLAVCVLGMALVMLNDRLGRRQEAPPPVQTSERPLSSPRMPGIITEDREYAMAENALDPPARETGIERTPLTPLPPPVEDVKPVVAPEPAPEVVDVLPPPPAPKPVVAAKPEPAPKPVVAANQEPAPKKPEPPKKDEKAAPAETKTATRFIVYARDKGATVRIGGNGKVDYTSMTLEDPNRVVVDLNGEWKFPPNPGIPKNDLVSAVRVGKNGDKTRVVIDLKGKPRKVLLVPFKSGDGVDVRVDR